MEQKNSPPDNPFVLSTPRDCSEAVVLVKYKEEAGNFFQKFLREDAAAN